MTEQAVINALSCAGVPDAYPSRCGERARLFDRIDPVVHAPSTSGGPLPAVQVERYEKQGFVVLPNVFDADEVAFMQREMARLQDARRQGRGRAHIAEPGDTTLRSVFAIHETEGVFQRLARDSRLVDLARFLLDDEVYIHQSRLNYKPGFRGREFYWHSDFETWHAEDGMPRMRALSMSIALTANASTNGPLMIIPGSHKRFVSCPGETPEEHYRESLRRQEYGVPPDTALRELVEEGGIDVVDAQPGSVVVFDCNAMHGSNGNITPYPRSNAFFVYNAVSNVLAPPFCGREPRPEFVCNRSNTTPLAPVTGSLCRE